MGWHCPCKSANLTNGQITPRGPWLIVLRLPHAAALSVLAFVVLTLLPLLQAQPESSGSTLQSSPSKQGSMWHHHFWTTMDAGRQRPNNACDTASSCRGGQREAQHRGAHRPHWHVELVRSHASGQACLGLNLAVTLFTSDIGLIIWLLSTSFSSSVNWGWK